MTVPMQRGERDDPTVTNLILGRLDDLATGFQRLEDRITQRVEEQAKQFLPRGEYEARHSDVRNQITKLDARADAEAAKLGARIESEVSALESRIDTEVGERKALEEKLAAQIQQQAAQLTQQRRFAIGTFLSACAVLIPLLSLILANLPA